jgi:DNA-binding CsgD family transcriptional regulator
VSPGEAALTGSPPARRLYREIAADPQADLLLEVVGVGGSGKSVLLDVLERLYTESGVPVQRGAHPAPTVLLDDAHLVPAGELHRLTDAVRAGEVRRLILARRPWPRDGALAELGAELADRRAPLHLTDLDRSGVAGRAAIVLGDRPTVALADAVLRQTAGHPALVSRLLDTLAAAGTLQTVRPGDPPPPGLVEQLGYQLDRLPAAVRALVSALGVGAPLDTEVLAPMLETSPIEVADLVEQAAAAGLLVDPAGPEGGAAGLRPLYRRAALAGVPAVRRLTLRRKLAEVQLERGSSVLECAVDLLGSDATGAQVAAVFEAAADELLRDGKQNGSAYTGAPANGAGAPARDQGANGAGPGAPLRMGMQSKAAPELAGRLLDAAVRAGAPAITLAARRAEAAARHGDLDRALELADQVLAAPDAVSADDRARAVGVAAAALAQRGLLARSAELYRWLGASDGWSQTEGAVAVPALLGTGALDEARELLEPAGTAPNGPPRLSAAPTLLAGAEALLARGMYDTIAGSPTAALSQLARASALLEPRAATVLLPDTPAALAALVAAHCGELDVATSVLERAVATGLGGVGAAARHRLLQGWVLMSRGAGAAAGALLAEVDARGTLEPRDELVAAALEVGLARRAGDLGALMPAWGRAREAIVRHPVDLYVLQPLGELIVAAARLREQSWVRPHVDEAHALLARLGEPVLWSTSIHYAEMHAALVAEQWDDAERAVAALQRGAHAGRYVAALAAAGPHWVAVLRDGLVDAVAVESAARGLHAVGQSWEGGKLAGQAAIRSTDRKAMSALLQCARGLQSTAPAAEPAAGSPPVPAPAARPGDHPGAAPPARPDGAAGRPAAAPAAAHAGPQGALSEREVEVAELVLAGLTYKEIGERLFISAKTVEHHVARMRQRLGSTSRGELMAHLRMIVNP